MNLVLLAPGEVAANGSAHLTGPRARHLLDVLRVVTGQVVRVGVVDGPLGTATVASVDPVSVGLTCQFEGEPPPLPRVDLLLALPRPKVMRRLWAQLAALGVGRIVLTNAERVERPYFDTHILAATTYVPLFIEGLQQARDTRLPRVSVHRLFRPLVEDELDGLSPRSIRLLADPGRGVSPVEAVAHAAPDQRILLAVGPEGGWNDFERHLLEAHRFVPVTLGPRTLRSDTAAVALLAVVHEAMRKAGG